MVKIVGHKPVRTKMQGLGLEKQARRENPQKDLEWLSIPVYNGTINREVIRVE